MSAKDPQISNLDSRTWQNHTYTYIYIKQSIFESPSWTIGTEVNVAPVDAAGEEEDAWSPQRHRLPGGGGTARGAPRAGAAEDRQVSTAAATLCGGDTSRWACDSSSESCDSCFSCRWMFDLLHFDVPTKKCWTLRDSDPHPVSLGGHNIYF